MRTLGGDGEKSRGIFSGGGANFLAGAGGGSGKFIRGMQKFVQLEEW